MKKKKGKEVPVYDKPLDEYKNYQKQKEKIQDLYRRLANIRNNHLHQATAKIVKAKPSRIVMEDLNVKGMMKNRHLSKAIQSQKFYEFKRQITYKCRKYGIMIRQRPRRGVGRVGGPRRAARRQSWYNKD